MIDHGEAAALIEKEAAIRTIAKHVLGMNLHPQVPANRMLLEKHLIDFAQTLPEAERAFDKPKQLESALGKILVAFLFCKRGQEKMRGLSEITRRELHENFRKE